MKRTASGIMLTILLVSMFVFACNIQSVRASGTIYVRPDGSIDPPAASIQRNGDVYTLTGNISDSIVIQRNNIVVEGNGYTVDNPGPNVDGFYWNGIDNVTVKNTNVHGFEYAFHLTNSLNSVLRGNNITFCNVPIYLDWSSNNTVSGNTIREFSCGCGVCLDWSSNNTVSGNTIEAGGYACGVSGVHSPGNDISGNNISSYMKGVGLDLESCNDSLISRNNIMGNEYGGAFVGGDNNTVSGNSITGNYGGGLLIGGNNNTVSGNNITNNSYGGVGISGNDNTVSGNNITANNECGITLSSSNNTVSGNNIVNNGPYGIALYGSPNNISGNRFFNDGLMVRSAGNVVVDNLVNGNPLVYLEDVSDYIVEVAGQVILVNCNRVRVENLSLSHTSIGAELWQTNNTEIRGNNITNNSVGVDIGGNNNTVSGNNITANSYDGICLGYYSSNNSVSENNIGNNGEGIELSASSYNGISGNNITANNLHGIVLYSSNYNSISRNNIAANSDDPGIQLFSSSNNNVSGNNIVDNWAGIGLGNSSGNIIYHNNFNNAVQVSLSFGLSANVLDSGSEGNYWSDYNGTDANHDGIGDTTYVIDSNNTDHYPLMNPYWIPADVNHDLKVGIQDVVKITSAYGCTPTDLDWNPHADIAEPYGKIDILDIVLCTSHYGEKCT